MIGAMLTVAAAPIGWGVSLLILRGIEMCVDHEMRMLDRRPRDGEALRDGDDRLNVHEQGYDL